MEIEEAKRRARSGPLLLLARRAFALILTFVSTVTVSRLVSPAAYGLANMALVILAFAQVFRDFGLTNAVLRKGIISPEEMSFIFWFNAAATTALALFIAAISPMAASFYHEPVVTWVILVSLIGFVVGGLSGQHRALMGRDLRFGAIALIDSAGLAAGFLSTLTLAFFYHNVWSIVIGTVVQSVFSSGLNVWISGWRPGPPKKIDDLGSLLKFGANSSVFSLSVFMSNNAASVLIGHFIGASSLGQYNRADALKSLPLTNLVQPITQATMPLLTRLRSEPPEYRLAYVGLVRKLCTVLFPISIMLVFAAGPLVRALLGNRWDAAGQVLAVLSPTLIAVAVAGAASDLFITQDRADELRTVGLIETVARVGAILVGVRFGLIATAFAFTASTTFAVALRMIVAGRKGPVTIGDQLGATLPSIPMAVGSGVGCFMMTSLADHLALAAAPASALLLTGGIAGGMVIGVLIPASRAAMLEIIEIFGLDRVLRRKVGRTARV